MMRLPVYRRRRFGVAFGIFDERMLTFVGFPRLKLSV